MNNSLLLQMKLPNLSRQANQELKRQARIKLASRSFWHYCLYTDSEVYRKPHLKTLCIILNNLFYGLPVDKTGKVYKKIIISLPPRHWKTRTLIHFCSWALGKNQEHRIIAGTYNEKEAADYGKFTRDEIMEESNDPCDIVFSDVFLNDDGDPIRLKQGDMGKSKWALERQHFNFLSTSPHGSLTGKGGTIKILDDLVKDAEKAMNAAHLDSLFTWYVSTFASRTEGLDRGEPIEIICATRWSKNDPTGSLVLHGGKSLVHESDVDDPTTSGHRFEVPDALDEARPRQAARCRMAAPVFLL